MASETGEEWDYLHALLLAYGSLQVSHGTGGGADRPILEDAEMSRWQHFIEQANASRGTTIAEALLRWPWLPLLAGVQADASPVLRECVAYRRAHTLLTMDREIARRRDGGWAGLDPVPLCDVELAFDWLLTQADWSLWHPDQSANDLTLADVVEMWDAEGRPQKTAAAL